MFKIIICILAGLGAGLGTGFAGMSAAAVISPMLITFLHMDPYLAVGIALASDVLASAASAYTYGKNKNLDIKNGVIMMISVLCFTLVGSYIASIVPKATMGSFSTLMTLFLGIKYRQAGIGAKAAVSIRHRPTKSYSFCPLRRYGRFHLWLCGRRRRHDDAACTHLRARL